MYLYVEGAHYYDTLSSIYHNVFPSCNNSTSCNLTKTMSPFAVELYDRFLSMSSTNLVDLRNFLNYSNSSSYFTSFSSFDDKTALLGLHLNVHNSIIFYKMLMAITTSISLIVVVNIHTIIAFFSRTLAMFSDFFSLMVRKYGTYFDPIRDAINFSAKNSTNNANKSNSNSNNSSKQKNTTGSSGKDDQDRNDPSNNPFVKDNIEPNISIREVLIAILHIHSLIIH